jgi:hypothetical protein
VGEWVSGWVGGGGKEREDRLVGERARAVMHAAVSSGFRVYGLSQRWKQQSI